jgi:ParB-like chromosome segregation protein Spo0J
LGIGKTELKFKLKHIFKTQDISLKSLSLHPDNGRAGSGAGYSDEQIAPLAANIGACGLLQPMLVAPLPKGSDTQWGVLAGGRRLAALKMLAGDAAAKGFTVSMKVACRIVPESDAAQVTLSYSENALQLPMDALDRFEAFAAMQTRDHADVATIARTFAITERAVKEALRLGNIHNEIRQAHREGVLSLEALKAFDAHPDQVVQRAAFANLIDGTGGRIQQWAVNQYFQGRFVRVGEALGQVVLEGYNAAGGAITADLIAEDSVLEDSAVIEAVLHQVLSDAADARCASLGLSWITVTSPIHETVVYQNLRQNPSMSAKCEFRHRSISRVRRKSAMTGRTAALRHLRQWPVGAVNGDVSKGGERSFAAGAKSKGQREESGHSGPQPSVFDVQVQRKAAVNGQSQPLIPSTACAMARWPT